MVIEQRVGGCFAVSCSSRFTLGIYMLMFLLALVTCANATIAFAASSTCSEEKLKEAIRYHNEHLFRMDKKFKDVWYYQGKVPEEISNRVTIDSIRNYLRALPERRAAVLFHSVINDMLCSWLITATDPVVHGVTRSLISDGWDKLKPTLWTDLGVSSVYVPRDSRVNNARKQLTEEESLIKWKSVLQGLSDLLLPSSIINKLMNERTDTLIVVPVSIRFTNYPNETEESSATDMSSAKTMEDLPTANRLVLSIGTVPFLALPISQSEVVANRMSVIVSPGFFTFGREPIRARRHFREPLVIGAPQRTGLEPLEGALTEAENVAKRFGRPAWTGLNARMRDLLAELNRPGSNLDFLLLATHGIASATNPIDESFLEFSDGSLSARNISALREPVPGSDPPSDQPKLKSSPVVVMSACQTGLGKDFAVGTIGLARAWQWAGASNVIMSLWSVDDEATALLIDDFVGHLLKGIPPDKALRSAALKLRNVYPNPAFWAAFNVFGAPELEPKE